MLKVLGVCVSVSEWSAETTLACWVAGFIILCLATRWLGQKKNVVSMSRIDPVRMYNAPSLVCLIANIVHFSGA